MWFSMRRRAKGLPLLTTGLLLVALSGGVLLYNTPTLYYAEADWVASARYDSSDIEAINVVLAHVGVHPPPRYMGDCIQQIRASNTIQDNTHIWIIVKDGQSLQSQLQINHLERRYLHFVDPNDLAVDVGSGQWPEDGVGFWAVTTRRILYIESLVRRENLSNVFMMESDNLLYMHLRQVLPALQQNYPGVGATRDSPVRAIAGLTWISTPAAMTHFAQFIREHVGESTNDMQLLADYIDTYESDPSIVSTFPVVPPWDHQLTMTMRDQRGNEVTIPEEISTYARNFDVLGESIFDAAALGQYLMGIDGPWGQWTRGYINPDAVYEVAGWTYTWQMETYQGVSSWTPFIVRNPAESREVWQVHRINNLHVHHKNLGYHRALPEGPDIPANSILFRPTEESGAQRGSWVEQWNDQTNEFRSRIAEGECLSTNHLGWPIRPWSYPLLTGDGLRLIADYGRDDDDADYFSQLDTTSFKPGTVVMVPSPHLRVFFSRPAPTVPYILISGNSDTGPTPEMARHLEGNSSLWLWIAQNPTFTHPHLLPLPIGFKNRQWPEGDLARLLSQAQLAHGPVGPPAEGVPLNAASPSAARPQSQRDILLYVNSGLLTPGDQLWTAAVTAWAEDRPDVLIVRGRIPLEEFLNDLRRSRYVLSPSGNGLDSHGTWEGLLMGAIPIVQHSPMDSLFVHHPVLLVNGPEDVTPELLEDWKPSSWTRHNLWLNTWYDRIVRTKEECALEWITRP